MVYKLPPMAFGCVFCITAQMRACLKVNVYRLFPLMLVARRFFNELVGASGLRRLARRSSFFCGLTPCDSLHGLPSSIIVSQKIASAQLLPSNWPWFRSRRVVRSGDPDLFCNIDLMAL